MKSKVLFVLAVLAAFLLGWAVESCQAPSDTDLPESERGAAEGDPS